MKPTASRSPLQRLHFSLSGPLLSLRLLCLAAVFLFLYAAILTLAPAARARSWQVDLRWNHWPGFLLWAAVFFTLQLAVRRRRAEADPFLLPIAALLTGWGLLTIYRLEPAYGLRQTFWLAAGGGLLLAGLLLPDALGTLRRYKYLWLAGGLLLTALTLVFGTNPSGGGPRLWLGCCGVYLQPSEPLKLLFIVFLAAFLADRLPLSLRSWPLLAPTAVVAGLALLLLVFQRDLGTASVFIFIYTLILFIASGKTRLLLFSAAALLAAFLAGYSLFDVVQLRVDAWLNPWLDPSGRSFQIVQSLMAVANGGTLGRGPGLGNPGLVPVAISDFIFASLAEEGGLSGSLALLSLFAFLTLRGLHVALRAPDNYRRLLATGLAAYIGTQAILIIGGNIRLLPLTGVTLPFVSYGGSSLVTSLVGLGLLILISDQPEQEPAALTRALPFQLLSGLLLAGFLALAVTNGWWGVVRGPDLLDRTDNARRTIADRYVQRGALLDRHEQPINLTEGVSGEYVRVYQVPDLGPIAGYTNAVYGQSGLEASLDDYLRGLQGNPAALLWWDHLLYGQPPPGLDVRLSLDLELQATADALLAGQSGAVILVNAESGEILVMSSHPAFDPNLLDQQAEALLADPAAPLLNRAVQGLYPAGELTDLFLAAAGYESMPAEAVAEQWYGSLGFRSTPALRLTVAEAPAPGEPLVLSPLQVVLAAAALSSEGVRPAPRLAIAVRSPIQGWVVLPSLQESVPVYSPALVKEATAALQLAGTPFWTWSGTARNGETTPGWTLGGTLADWQTSPLAAVVLLESGDAEHGLAIVQALLEQATRP